jgi:ribose transport system permease protein
VAALTVRAGLPLVLALPIGVVVGAAVGAISGFVVAYLRANSFIITLGMATLIGGLVSLYTKDQVILGVRQSMVNFGTLNWLGMPRPVWLLVVVALAVAYLLRYTAFGRQLLSIGSSPRAATLVGIRVPLVVLLSFVVTGALAALAGELELAWTGGDPQIGPGFTLSALAAAFLGSTTIRPAQFNVPGTIVGVVFAAVSVNGPTLAGAADWVDSLFTGTAVVAAVAISTVLAHRRGGPLSITGGDFAVCTADARLRLKTQLDHALNSRGTLRLVRCRPPLASRARPSAHTRARLADGYAT